MSRIVIVGGGPAGVAAAATLAKAGMAPILIDAAASTGGQIYRRQPPGFTRPPEALYGPDAAKAGAVHARLAGLDLDYRAATTVFGLYQDRLHIHDGMSTEELQFERLVLATGATDRVVPVPGWTLPGVTTLGAAQIALKAQACAIGRRVAFAGAGPLLYLVAAQYLAAGVKVAAVLDTGTRAARVAALPDLAARPGALARGVGLIGALRRGGVAIHTGVSELAIAADEEGGAGAVRWSSARGAGEVMVDAVGLGWHLRAETQLADLAGLDFAYDATQRQWLPSADAMGRASRPGLYLAGDGAALLGADGAEVAGELAAYAILTDIGRPVAAGASARLIAQRARHARFARGVARAWPFPEALCRATADDTLVCRCEAISAGSLRAELSRTGVRELNRAKAFTRVGMGRCQGRFCALAAAEIAADALGEPVAQLGRLRAQAPIKPLPAGVRCAPSQSVRG